MFYTYAHANSEDPVCKMSTRSLTISIFLMTVLFIVSTLSSDAGEITNGVNSEIERDDDLSLALEKLHNVHCRQLKTYRYLFETHGFIPNSWNTTTAALENNKGADLMVQPRMLQYAMNLLLANDHLGADFSQCAGNVLENTIEGIKRFSSDYTVPLPWKKTPEFQDKIDEPMTVYDIGDWLMVVSVTAMVSENYEIDMYLQRVVDASSQLLGSHVTDNRFPGRFTYGYVATNHPLEVGHATLLIDGLLYAHLATGNIEMLSLAKTYYRTASQRQRRPIFENLGGEDNFSTLMTYGELLESTNLLHFITMDDFYLNDGKRIVAEMLDEFMSPEFDLNYRQGTDGAFSPCKDAMGLEAAVYQSLVFFRSEMTEAELTAVFAYIKSFTDHIHERGYVPQLVCAENSHNNLFLIGNQYGLLKTLFYIKDTPSLSSEAGKHGIDPNEAIRLIIDRLASFDLPFGLPNALGDEDTEVITDPGGNVWMFNEAIMPILIERKLKMGLFNMDRMHIKKHRFVGCNYLFLTV